MDSSCPICLENFDEVDAESGNPLLLRVRLSCSHEFCETCVVAHLQDAIDSKKIPVLCPESDCNVLIKEESIGKMLSDALLERWGRLQALVDNPSLVECPSCNALVDSKTTRSTYGQSRAEKKSDNNKGRASDTTQDQNEEVTLKNSDDLECRECSHPFCRVHGDMHQGQTCESFKASDAGTVLYESERILDEVTKPCSHCGARLHKQEGCDYVICANCKQDMCYKCGSHEHMTEGRLRHCAKCGGAFDGRLDFAWWMILLIMLAFLLLYLFYIPVALVAVILSGCCCGFFRCGRGLNSQNPTFEPRRGMIGCLVTLILPYLLVSEAGSLFAFRYLPDTWFTRRYVTAASIPVQELNETAESSPNEESTEMKNQS